MIMNRTLTQKINTTYSVTADRTTPKQIYKIDSNEQKLLQKTREQLTNRKMAATAATHTVTRRLAGTDQQKRVPKGLTENRTQDCSMEWRGRQKRGSCYKFVFREAVHDICFWRTKFFHDGEDGIPDCSVMVLTNFVPG
ncbi:hypothetical protein M9H77_09338 [Catharanthus roseus]|uniref:Uncharacterized protein n=1 Tax=Catharanthus roseus TaxID=4058 RepID=A0ACC0C0V3_CATRO|nr:hypothetical protein M9H77_09338 [Catharanthus roseus]